MLSRNHDLKIGVIGAGSWGTTLANLLSNKGLDVTLWVYEAELFEAMSEKRENTVFLPQITLNENLRFTNSLEEASKDKHLIVSVTPSHFVRTVMKEIGPYLRPDAAIVSASKGIENDSLMTMSEVLRDVLPPILHPRLCFLSGPSFAREVAVNKPTVVAVASKNRSLAQDVQQILATPYFRVYTNYDVIGVEIGGALKNVIAIAAGACDGLGLGSNSQAALITRGLAEMARLGIRMGANPLTFSGLTGMGDLVLTCTDNQSRNRSVGYHMGQGEKIDDILGRMKMVAEGIKTTRSAYNLMKRHEVDMPITEQVYNGLYEGKPAAEVVDTLMNRSLKSELQGLFS